MKWQAGLPTPISSPGVLGKRLYGRALGASQNNRERQQHADIYFDDSQSDTCCWLRPSTAPRYSCVAGRSSASTSSGEAPGSGRAMCSTARLFITRTPGAAITVTRRLGARRAAFVNHGQLERD